MSAISNLWQDESSYTKSPGVSDYSSFLVESTSGSRPHFVQKTGTNVYKCDHDCLMFKSTNGMCSHSLLASSLNDQTEAYVRQYTKKPLPELISRKLTRGNVWQALRPW